MAKATATPPVRTRPGDMADEAYARLRDLIVEGVLEPGQRLPQAKLMELVHVGRTPLRTALSRLRSDGLVVATPNHGAVVAAAPASSAEEIYTMRFLVEPPLLEATAASIGADRIARMRALLATMEETLGEPAAFAAAHREFHTVERATFASPFIDGLVNGMYAHLHRLQRVRPVRTRGTSEDFLAIDRLTVDALAEGDLLRARRMLEFHLVDAAVSFLLTADEGYRPAVLLGVTRANGMVIEAEPDGTLSPPARVRWEAPCPSLPRLATPYLVYDPE